MSERENFNKLIKLLAGGGTLVLRQLLEKYSAPLSFSDYVYQNQVKVLDLRFFENQRTLVVTREIDKMDITLLGKLVIGLFKDSITETEKNSVNNIKEERDSFMHSDVLKEAKIEEHVFNRRWKTISSILLDIAAEIGPTEFKTDLETFIKDTQEESSSQYDEIHEILIKWCESNEQLEEKVNALELTVQNMKDTCTTIVSSVECGALGSLKEKFQCNYEYNTRLDTRLTNSMVEAKEYLQKAYSVLLYGNPGEGKTFSAFQIVKHLVENNIVTLERCALLSKPEDLDLVRKADIDLILIDDIFGKHNTDSNKFAAWEKDFATLQSIVGTGKIRIIMCSRMHIYEECRKKLDGLDIFSRTTELSSAKLSQEERSAILIQQLEVYKRNVNEVNVDECVAQEFVGFPLCAQQFASDNLLFSKKTEYFRKPYKYFLDQNIKALDDQSFIALLFVFYKGNTIHLTDLDITRMSKDTQDLLVHVAKLRGVEKPTSLIVKETKEKVTSMKNSYVKCIDNDVSFFHDTMYETVAKLHYQEYPSEVIKYCTLDYLCQCVFLEGQNNGEVITVHEAYFKPFVERCIDELIKIWNGYAWGSTNFEKLINHQIFQHPNSKRELLGQVQRDKEVCEKFLTVFCRPDLFNPDTSKPYYSMWLKDATFLKEIMPYLDCMHIDETSLDCWKCAVKAEILAAVCYYDRKDLDLYTFLRSYKVPLSSISLYKAVMNENIDSDFVNLLIGELSQKNLSIREKYLMQMGLGMALNHGSPRVYNVLKAGGLLPSTVMCYCAVRIGSDQEIHASILFIPLQQHNQWEPNIYHVLKCHQTNMGSAKISCEVITATKNEREPFQNWDLIGHGIKFIKDWADRVKLMQMDEDEMKLFAANDTPEWEATMSSFTELQMKENGNCEMLNEETALTTALLIKELTMAGFIHRFTMEQWHIITQRKKHDKNWNQEDVVVCLAALIDEDLSVQPRKIWRGIEPRDSAKTRYLGVSVHDDVTGQNYDNI